MDFETYKKKYFTDPAPEPRFGFKGILGTAVYYQDYAAALAFFEQVFGAPAYVEGEFTHAWQLGNTWLTVFPAKQGSPSNVEVMVYLKDAKEVDRLYAEMIAAGASGEPPVDTLMFVPVRIATLQDPFGGQFSLAAEIPE